MKEIPGYPNYLISIDGKVFSKSVNRFIKPYKHKSNSKQYLRITLCKNNRPKKIFIHELVLLTYVGPKPIKKECNHIDHNSMNNNIDNLEYVTASENQKHKYKK